MAQLVKNPPAMWETQVQFLDWEDTLEKGKATHSSTLAWRIPWTVKSMAGGPGGRRGVGGTYLVAQMVKHLPTMPETQAQSLVWEDLLEKEMATHSSNLA